MKKIFLVAGELSGDKLGAWYVKKIKQSNMHIACVGGDFLEREGAHIYERFETLNIVGIVEIVKHLGRILRFMRDLANHIVSNEYEELVVIDFPGFNLNLIKKVKKLNPNIKITYLSPPQLWIWGSWRIKKIKKYCDDVIVIYPFEVEWYKKRGVEVRWLGYPFYETLKPYMGAQKIAKNIAIIPGSREVEIERLLPLFIKIIHRFKLANPGVKIFLPLAESIDKSKVEKILRQTETGRWGQDIVIVQGEQEKLRMLSSCCVALTKPGTITLELALLGVPSVVAYKAPWLTYFIARMLVKVDYMSLANLLLQEEVFPEFIQSDCKIKKILPALERFCSGCSDKKEAYQVLVQELGTLREVLKATPSSIQSLFSLPDHPEC